MGVNVSKVIDDRIHRDKSHISGVTEEEELKPIWKRDGRLPPVQLKTLQVVRELSGKDLNRCLKHYGMDSYPNRSLGIDMLLSEIRNTIIFISQQVSDLTITAAYCEHNRFVSSEHEPSWLFPRNSRYTDIPEPIMIGIQGACARILEVALGFYDIPSPGDNEVLLATGLLCILIVQQEYGCYKQSVERTPLSPLGGNGSIMCAGHVLVYLQGYGTEWNC
ncbi:hypothetical protein PSN45_003747 [Yamadazyma tenuis]|uniref:uncharacterized protein n=1 Tax=Candida tenuis TaxID=2315449 RepID=UPI0027A27DB2|nr:hypothetical protein PSN45_003747 [Yamadazyma tenuis]